MAASGFRRGIQAVIYRNGRSGREFLVLHRILHWVGWEFLKGGREAGETEEEAVLRELSEEASIRRKDIIRLWATRHKQTITYAKEYLKTSSHVGAINRTFIVELSGRARVNILKNTEKEHDRFEWVPKGRAKKLLHPDLAANLDKFDREIGARLRASEPERTT